MLGKNITKFQLRFTFKFKFLKVSFGYSIISFFKHKFLMENFLRNHPYIMSAKGLGEWNKKWQLLLTQGGSEKVQKCAGVIQGWSLTFINANFCLTQTTHDSRTGCRYQISKYLPLGLTKLLDLTIISCPDGLTKL